ncbi:MAG: ATP synthase F1 subunit epsilon [Ruminococcus sp.]|jgi:F-type H+-transporting ATPase subunit epsilon|nr:ATP synthase F1 subunit epsilon [Ruminococcus sp.]
MAALFKIKIITPEKVFFDDEGTLLIVKTGDGERGIMANHISYVAALPSCPLRIQFEDGSWRTASLSSGLLKVGQNKATVIANAIEWAEEIDLDWARRSEKDARERLSKLSPDEYEHELANLKLKRALNRMAVKSQNK